MTAPAVISFGGCDASTGKLLGWKGGDTIGLLCSVQILDGMCPNTAEACGPPNVSGFEVCATQTTGIPCPASMPVQHVFFWSGVACDCGCGPSSGDSCSETLTAYSDAACSKPVGSGTVTTADSMTCFDVTAGPLGSQKATFAYTPGMCQPTVTKVTPQTLCCLH
jgi:hypothetical protein